MNEIPSVDGCGARLPDHIVCPRCHGALNRRIDHLDCAKCGATYHQEGGFYNLLADPEDRFEDDTDAETCCSEESSNAFAAENYYIPLFKKLLGDKHEGSLTPRILSCGCGVGADVDLHIRHGYEAWGIDCGQRADSWKKRKNQHRLFVANAKSLPFADDSFDLVKTDCLLPHIGVDGDTAKVKPGYFVERAEAAREMARVVKPGGYIILANPNRWCPVDLFHKGQMKNSNGIGQFHSPSERFLLSFSDYQRLFLQEAGCGSLESLPIDGYWGFFQKSSHPWKRYLVPLIQGYFHLMSIKSLSPLRRTALNPWLMVMVRK